MGGRKLMPFRAWVVHDAWDRDDCRIRGILDTVSDIMETGGNGQEDGLML